MSSGAESGWGVGPFDIRTAFRYVELQEEDGLEKDAGNFPNGLPSTDADRIAAVLSALTDEGCELH